MTGEPDRPKPASDGRAGLVPAAGPAAVLAADAGLAIRVFEHHAETRLNASAAVAADRVIEIF